MKHTPEANPDGTSYAEGFSHQPLRQRVAEVIREAIFSGQLLPGAALVEKTIADDLSISRAPVREAIRMLAKEGLVESIPYKGSRVRILQPRDVQEVYAMRGLLESYALRQVLAADAPADISPIVEACVDMETAAANNDAAALTAADDRFHSAIIELAGNDLLLGMWGLIALRARQAMALRNVQLGDLAILAANHRAIVDAMRNNDLDLSLALIAEHVDSGAQLILEDWVQAT